MAAEARSVLKAYFETGDNPTQAQFANLIDSFLNFVSDFGIFFAHVSQSGTSAPTFADTFSTLSFTPTWSYDSVGHYHLTSTGNLNSTKVFMFIGTSDAPGISIISFADLSPDAYSIETYDASDVASNGILNKTPFLMFVLP